MVAAVTNQRIELCQSVRPIQVQLLFIRQLLMDWLRVEMMIMKISCWIILDSMQNYCDVNKFHGSDRILFFQFKRKLFRYLTTNTWLTYKMSRLERNSSFKKTPCDCDSILFCGGDKQILDYTYTFCENTWHIKCLFKNCPSWAMAITLSVNDLLVLLCSSPHSCSCCWWCGISVVVQVLYYHHHKQCDYPVLLWL